MNEKLFEINPTELFFNINDKFMNNEKYLDNDIISVENNVNIKNLKNEKILIIPKTNKNNFYTVIPKSIIINELKSQFIKITFYIKYKYLNNKNLENHKFKFNSYVIPKNINNLPINEIIERIKKINKNELIEYVLKINSKFLFNDILEFESNKSNNININNMINNKSNENKNIINDNLIKNENILKKINDINSDIKKSINQNNNTTNKELEKEKKMKLEIENKEKKEINELENILRDLNLTYSDLNYEYQIINEKIENLIKKNLNKNNKLYLSGQDKIEYVRIVPGFFILIFSIISFFLGYFLTS